MSHLTSHWSPHLSPSITSTSPPPAPLVSPLSPHSVNECLRADQTVVWRPHVNVWRELFRKFTSHLHLFAREGGGGGAETLEHNIARLTSFTLEGGGQLFIFTLHSVGVNRKTTPITEQNLRQNLGVKVCQDEPLPSCPEMNK